MLASALVSVVAPMPIALGACTDSVSCEVAGLGRRPLSCFTMSRCVTSGSGSESTSTAGVFGLGLLLLVCGAGAVEAVDTPPSVMSVATGWAEGPGSVVGAGWLAAGFAGAGAGWGTLVEAAAGFPAF